MGRFSKGFVFSASSAMVACAGCSSVSDTLHRAASSVSLPTRASAATPRVKNTWQPISKQADPTAQPLLQFRTRLRDRSLTAAIRPTNLHRADYLKLMASEVDFWKKHQNADGAIIDPYRKVEVQYSTPAFAHAAAALVVYANRQDLLEPAARATDWSVRTLSQRKSVDHHEDFYAPLLAHAIPLLQSKVTPQRADEWSRAINAFDPFATYRIRAGGNNWNMVALSGEGMFQRAGLRSPSDGFVKTSLAGQGRSFGSPWGLYLEGPMAYDHFPRLWAADMLAHGYTDSHTDALREMLRRASLTSLFMQSPWGELPAGGRSAQHQWNEAEQCVTFEIYANIAQQNNDPELAGVFKRAAHLSLASMKRWVRPSGEMQIVKNWIDPAARHGFESYSAHSQYNLLPMAMLAIACEHAEKTEAVAEKAAPADLGGFVVSVPELHKVFANVDGTYIEVDTNGDHHYDATGLIRVHCKGLSPQLGPSDSVTAHPAYRTQGGNPGQTVGVGLSWPRGGNRGWSSLGETDQAGRVQNITEGQTVGFDVVYDHLDGAVSHVVEHYQVGRGRVELTTTTPGYFGPLRYTWPMLADDGSHKTSITTLSGKVSVSLDGNQTAQTFTPVGAARLSVGTKKWPNHNGWAYVASAEYPAQKKRQAVTLVIVPKTANAAKEPPAK